MNLKLPVDVLLSVNPAGSFALTVGGMDFPIEPDDVPRVMAGRPPQPVPSNPGPARKMFPSGKPVGRPPAPMCRYGDAKAVPGKGLCQKHMAVAVRSVAKARLAKKKAAA